MHIHEVGISFSAPGSIMLFGEHAVLRNYPAIVTAIDKRIKITLIPRIDNKIFIHSSLGNTETSLKNLSPEKPHEYILACIQQFQKKLNQGFNLIVESQFLDTLGLGSSAAVTVATASVIYFFLENHLNQDTVFNHSLKAIRQVQGQGSGADVAASTYGGTLSYTVLPSFHDLLPLSYPLTLIYSGSKTKTSLVINSVNNGHFKHPSLFDSCFQAIGECTKEAIEAIKSKNWGNLGTLMNIHQGLQEAIGTSNLILSQLAHQLRLNPNILGSKISGSGLGDCVVGLGSIPENTFSYTEEPQKKNILQIPISIEPQGVKQE